MLDESILTALKENQIQELDLNYNKLRDEDVQTLAKALKENTSLQQLGLSGNGIGIAGAQALAGALKINTSLQRLDLRDNFIREAGARKLAKMLKVNISLQQFNLRGNDIGDAGALAITEALKVNTRLQHLDLRNNFIHEAGAQALAEALKDNYTLTELYVIENSELRAELRAYLERNKIYQQAAEAFGKLADIEIQDLYTAAQTIIGKLEGIEKYPKAAELKKKVYVNLIQRYFELNEWESALTLNPDVLSRSEVCFSFADWLFRQKSEEIPAALALGNNDAELNRIRLAMLLLVEASQGNAAEIPHRDIETFKINIANRIIQNTKNQVATDKVGLTTASLTEITGVERLLSTGEWQAAIEQAAKVNEDEETKETLEKSAQQVSSHTVEDVRTLLSYTVIKNSLTALYKTDNCLPVGVMLLSPESLPWENQTEVSDIKALTTWFLRRRRVQHFASKQEEGQEAENNIAIWQTLGDVGSFKQQAIAALAAEAGRIITEEVAAEEARKEQQRQEQIRIQKEIAQQAQEASRWSLAKVILASSGVLLGLAAIGLGVSTAFISLALLTYLSIGAGSLSLLLLVGALSCRYQQKVVEVELLLTHSKISFSQEYIKDAKLMEPKEIAKAEQYQPLFTKPASGDNNTNSAPDQNHEISPKGQG